MTQPVSSCANDSPRAAFRQQLHRAYRPHEFDNWLVWAGNLELRLDGRPCTSALARAYVGPQTPPVQARVQVELFVAAVDPAEVRRGDVEARLWTDANERGSVDSKGFYVADPGRHLPMSMVCGPDGRPQLRGNNLVFESVDVPLRQTGVFSFTAQFSADAGDPGDPRRQWVSINEMAPNKDAVVVVSPAWVQDCPSILEMCARKAGARVDDGAFQSGRFTEITRGLADLPADIVYLLSFFEPGHFDLHTGEDVRKGSLGSVYAVADFFRVDPQLVSPPEEVDLASLVDRELVEERDLDELFGADLARELGGAPGLARLAVEQVAARVGRDALVQLIGRAELRDLTRRAHALGKRVIFDLVLMQTSRDSPLIAEHPDWYVLDENGRPSIHAIAWLVYSDVALFALVFNKPLQNYLLRIAPLWIKTCDLDGVRIDASQTVDRPFLKQIKNRINAVRPDALVLGETLCPLEEAVDVPVDMIYALMVDFHRDTENAAPFINFLEEMHERLAAGTVALAYFENHDSPRATRAWRDTYKGRLAADRETRRWWQQLSCGVQPDTGDRALLMALLKNLQASLFNATAGAAPGSNLSYGLEMGTEWGEEARTDFENPGLLHPGLRESEPHAALVRAYDRLRRCRADWPETAAGQVYYHRNEFPGGDPEDRVLGYVRHTGESALLVLHNLDAGSERGVRYAFDYLPFDVGSAECLFDTYRAFQLRPPCTGTPEADPAQPAHNFHLWPLQSRVFRLIPRDGEPPDDQ